METLIQTTRDYVSGLISPVDFRSKVVQRIDQFDRDEIDRFAGLLLFDSGKRERAEQAMSDAKKLSAGGG
jgi:hypothetical protein